MNFNLTAQLLLASSTLTVVLASAAGAIPPPTVAAPRVAPTVAPPIRVNPVRNTIPAPARPTQPIAVNLRCAQAGNGYATIVSKGTKQATLITWNSISFGPEYTPQARCNTVSQKFQTIVNKNGGKLSNLVLTVGPIGNLTVVCAINQGAYGCNRENMLFTLNPENAQNPGAVLASILQIGKYGSGSAVRETTELPEYNLEEVVNQKLSDSPEVTAPESSITPAEVPAAVTPSSSTEPSF